MEKKKKSKNKKKFTWVNLAQLLTVAALLFRKSVDNFRSCSDFHCGRRDRDHNGWNPVAPFIADDTGGPGRLSVCCGGRYCSGTDMDSVPGIGEIHECVLFGDHGSSESSDPAAFDPVVRHRLPVQGFSGIFVLGIYNSV